MGLFQIFTEIHKYIFQKSSQNSFRNLSVIISEIIQEFFWIALYNSKKVPEDFLEEFPRDIRKSPIELLSEESQCYFRKKTRTIHGRIPGKVPIA